MQQKLPSITRRYLQKNKVRVHLDYDGSCEEVGVICQTSFIRKTATKGISPINLIPTLTLVSILSIFSSICPARLGSEILILITLPPHLEVTPRPSAPAYVGDREMTRSPAAELESPKCSWKHQESISSKLAPTRSLSRISFSSASTCFFSPLFFLKKDFVKLEVMAFCRFLRGQTGTYLECLGFRFLWASVVGTRSRIQLCRYRHNVPPELRSGFFETGCNASPENALCCLLKRF